MDEFQKDYVMECNEIDSMLENKSFYKNESACTLYGRCDYMDLCAGGVNQANLAQYQRGMSDSQRQQLIASRSPKKIEYTVKKTTKKKKKKFKKFKG